LNELLHVGPSRLGDVNLAVAPDNQIVVHYGVVHATATLPPAIEAGPSPRLTLTLASLVVALALRAAVREPFLSFSGRRMTISLADVPALQPMRDLWPHVRRVGLSTNGKGVRVHVAISIDEAIDA
jgi:hypothetical protein